MGKTHKIKCMKRAFYAIRFGLISGFLVFMLDSFDPRLRSDEVISLSVFSFVLLGSLSYLFRYSDV